MTSFDLQIDNGKPTELVLLLSGGGFRATLFHLGVIDELRARGCINRVTHVVGVSGGAILAAWLVANWQRVTNLTDTNYADTLIDFAAKDVRGSITRDILASITNNLWKHSFAFALRALRSFKNGSVGRAASGIDTTVSNIFRQRMISEYESLYTTSGGRPLEVRELHPDQTGQTPRPPWMYLVATNYPDGELITCSQDGLATTAKGFRDQITGTDSITLGKCVAASTAFPPFLPAVPFLKSGMSNEHNLYLGDGGITDNLGVAAFLSCVLPLFKGDKNLTVIISDAEPAFDKSLAPDGDWNTFRRASRASELQMALAAGSAFGKLQGELKNRNSQSPALESQLFRVSLRGDRFRNKSAPLLSDACWKLLQHTRTDLDRFEGKLRDALRHAGQTLSQWVLPQAKQGQPSTFDFKKFGIDCGESSALASQSALQVVNWEATDASADSLRAAVCRKLRQLVVALLLAVCIVALGVFLAHQYFTNRHDLKKLTDKLDAAKVKESQASAKLEETVAALRRSREAECLLRQEELVSARVEAIWWRNDQTRDNTMFMETENPPRERSFFGVHHTEARRVRDGLLLRGLDSNSVLLNSANRWFSSKSKPKDGLVLPSASLTLLIELDRPYDIYLIEVYSLLDSNTPSIPPNQLVMLNCDPVSGNLNAHPDARASQPVPVAGNPNDSIWKQQVNLPSDHRQPTNQVHIQVNLDRTAHLSTDSIENWLKKDRPAHIQLLEIRVYAKK
jgi:predicted acylesterase/phospholipase RssA